MTRLLRALIVEDNPDDAELLLRELRRSGFDVDYVRVQTEDAMRTALGSKSWDIVLSDYVMPQFSALGTLRVLSEVAPSIPCIVLSGTIGEETAVEALKAGAQDFLVKGRLARLAPSIDRALKEAEVRRERHAAEEALRASEQKYRRIVETSQEGVWVIDADAKTSYVNSRMAEMLGEDASAVIGAPLLDFMDEEWAGIARSHLDRRKAGVAEQHEFKFRRRDGSEFWAYLSTAPIVGSEGYTGALAMVTDVTEKRKLQAQLMVADRMASVGLLAAGVAHEINNPLSAAIANLDLALRDASGLSVASDAAAELCAELEDAREAAERVRAIVLDLKIFSRSKDEELHPVDVLRVLESSARIAWNEIRLRARLVKRFEAIPPVHANEARLGQLFLNLIVNAAQAIPEGRADENEIVLVARTAPDGRVSIEIRDTGVGMPPNIVKQLFTPFFTTKPIGVGTGLGLSICHRIVSAVGGEITVESEVGKGTTFRVHLPASSEPLPEAPVVSHIPASAKRARVLVVDDEDMVRAAIRRALSRHHEVSATSSAIEALELLNAGERFDLILCDLMMPHMTGMDLHAELARTLPDQACRMVFLTGGAFTEVARQFLEQTENRWLEKPFDLDALRTLADRAVD